MVVDFCSNCRGSLIPSTYFPSDSQTNVDLGMEIGTGYAGNSRGSKNVCTKAEMEYRNCMGRKDTI